MKILIIGNGFDLAHSLPTTYKDFLDFIKLISFKYGKLFDYNTQYKLEDCNEYIKKYADDLFENIINDPNNNLNLNAYDIQKLKYKNIFDKLSKENREKIDVIMSIYEFSNIYVDKSKKFWINLFMELSYQYENWSDFETIISLIIQHIDYFKNCKNENDDDRKKFLDSNLESLSTTILDDKRNSNSYKSKIEEMAKNIGGIKALEESLEELIKILGLYLEQITNKESINKIKFFEELDVDKVISFNYTNTYEYLYDTDATSKAEYCFIHGKIQNSEGNNMVLGIDDYLKGEDANLNLDFIRFKKYYQRLYKKTDCNYKNWLEEKEEKEVHIYGHSLDISDKDILKEIIETEHTNTIIYYHTKSAYDQQIINLIKILGKDNLLKRVYNKNIKFLSTASIK